jgi:prepilin-type N-terminal cleavage/methylation domain-containing protein
MSRPREDRGMTLIEVLVAMALLLVGMSGILALFSTAVSLQAEATERLDVALLFPGVIQSITEDLAGRAGAGALALDGEYPVPGAPRYRYRVLVREDPTDPGGPVRMCHVSLVAVIGGQESVYDFGYLPVVPADDRDALKRILRER